MTVDPPHRLARLFTARDVAIVGASDSGPRSRNAITAMSRTGVNLHLVNRRGEAVMGRPTFRSLSELAEAGTVADAAMLFTNGAAAVDVVAEAAALGVGGAIVNAAGFAEAGPAGVALQDRLVAAAGVMPVIGPNCNGIVSPARGLHLAGSPPNLPIRHGALAFVTHSGATMFPLAIAGVERRIGFSYLVSTGNEAAVDMAQVIDYLAVDSATTAICLLVETIRDPPAFFRAVDRAIAAGKPVLALKNGRSARGQAIARSHTGAVAGEAWMAEAALRQHGVVVADDLVDLADRAVLFDQIPAPKWNRVEGLAVAAVSGGWVTMASDVCAEEGIALPELDSLLPRINDVVPEATIANPLDATGAAMIDAAVMSGVLRTYIGCDEVDTVLIQTSVGGGGTLDVFAGGALDVAPATGKLIVLGSVEGGPIGDDLDRYRDAGVAVCRGLRATVRALRSMGDFVTFQSAPVPDHGVIVPLACPASLIHANDGTTFLPFAATMALLARAGVPVAPHVLVAPSDEAIAAAMPFAGPYVVKLADVAHRSDIGAVRLAVSSERLATTVDELRLLAEATGARATVAVQPHYRITSELLVGANVGALGPFVVCGLGGVFVELLGRKAGRLAPFGETEAHRLLAELDTGGVLDGPRGTPPWPVDRLAEILSSVARFAVAARSWLDTVDINPLALSPDGIVAVDGLIIVRTEEPET